MPSWPAAPARVSTKNGWPKAAFMPSATVRHRKSAAPPGANVLTMRTGFDGQVSACAGDATSAAAAMASDAAGMRCLRGLRGAGTGNGGGPSPSCFFEPYGGEDEDKGSMKTTADQP